ncbi:hypothetical protein [Hymenobacter latericus]|uniref:hypothetical protein n=1 Tax=Hymenobacter sp. YIM 151858-1 TaxID=2987688 RepID=UPI002225E42F|nr:hypothetical protein [Hymenobacter sp. YIM 151858-1]UYZ60075.1 hypothetical protein OIS50_04565 [Hymenobacter sp. YIM 151858-1]
MPCYLEILPAYARGPRPVRRYDVTQFSDAQTQRFADRLDSRLPARYCVRLRESARRLPRLHKPVYRH